MALQIYMTKGILAEPVRVLFGMQRTRNEIEPSVVVQTCNPSTHEIKG